MTARLTMICQGATAANRTSVFPADDPLEERARSAIETLPEIAWRFDAALVSPKLAARQTAEALSVVCDEDPELRDIDYGAWAGQTIGDIATGQPEALAQWLADPAFDGHGGESLNRLFKRSIHWMAGRTAVGHAIAITHSAVMRAMVIGVLGAPVEAFWKIDFAPLTTLDLRHNGRRWALRACGSPLAGKPSSGYLFEGNP